MGVGKGWVCSKETQKGSAADNRQVLARKEDRSKFQLNHLDNLPARDCRK